MECPYTVIRLYIHSVASSLFFMILLTPYLSTGCCIRPFDVYVYMHILFIISDWDVNVLFSDSTTNKFCQLAHDLFVSLYCSAFLCFMCFLSPNRSTHSRLCTECYFAGWLQDMHLPFLITS